MESNDKLKEINIKNCTCCYFGGIIKTEDFDFDNILIDEKLYGNILVYNILYKTFISEKLLRIRFDKIDGSVRVYNWIRYLVLFGPKKCDAIYNLISQKRGILYVISQNYAKIKVDSYESLRIYYTMVLEKCSYK